MRYKFFVSFILTISIIFYGTFAINIDGAKAWMTGGALANMLPESLTSAAGWTQIAKDAATAVLDKIEKYSVVLAKVGALLAIQEATKLIIGGSKGSTVITNYETYLYTSPQQVALEKMNSFFSTVSHGRSSSMNYEGVGPNYDAYLIAQARQEISGQTFDTNLQNQVTDPSQIFSGGNMKGISAYLECANNVMCYTLVAKNNYDNEYTKAQTLAKSEDVNGFKPRKNSSGTITQPASLAQNALTQIDSLGKDMILNADPSDKESAYYEILQGSILSISARTSNYYISDDSGKAAIKNSNDKFPFSLSYNNKNGVSIGR